MGENNFDAFIIAYTVQCRMIKNTLTEFKTAKILVSCHDIVDNKWLLQELCINVSRAEQTTTYIAPYRKRRLLRKHWRMKIGLRPLLALFPK